MSRLRTTATAVLAATAFSVLACAAAGPATADTLDAPKATKLAVLSTGNGSRQPLDCYTVTVSDKYKNWALLSFNLNSTTNRYCSPFAGSAWFRKDQSTGEWEFVDSASYDDLVMGVPDSVIKEFKGKQSGNQSAF